MNVENSTLLDDIGNWLTAQNIVGGSTGWSLFKGFLPPDDPANPQDQMIAIFETPGEGPDIIRDPSIREKTADIPAFQVRGRSAVNGYRALRIQMQLIFEALHQNEPPSSLTSGETYVYIYAKTSGPLPMGKDEQNRDELAWNFTVMRNR